MGRIATKRYEFLIAHQQELDPAFLVPGATSTVLMGGVTPKGFLYKMIAG